MDWQCGPFDQAAATCFQELNLVCDNKRCCEAIAKRNSFVEMLVEC